MSREAEAFLNRPLFAGARALVGGLLVAILIGIAAAFFIKSAPGSELSVAGAVFQMFLRH